jgi:Icc-related predicted phosphoesterase
MRLVQEGLQIDLLSDTHCQEKSIKAPGGDLLLHAGDISYKGTIQEILPFLEWFEAQDYTHKVLVPGNHDWGFEKAFGVFADECKRRNIILLNDSGVTLEGIKIWGSPVQPEFCAWAFNRERGHDIRKHWNLIPEDTELLITHGPPKGILDATQHGEEVGCQDLLHKILKTQVKLHVFGHIHEGRGWEYRNNCLFVNASAVDRRYRIVTGKPIRVVKGIDGIYLKDGTILPE